LVDKERELVDSLVRTQTAG